MPNEGQEGPKSTGKGKSWVERSEPAKPWEMMYEPAKPSVAPPGTPEATVPTEDVVQTGEALRNLSGTPEFRIQTQRRAAGTPEQEAVRKRREETGGVKTYGVMGGIASTVDTTGISDPIISQIAASYNRRLGRRMIDANDREQVVREIEARLRDPAVPAAERVLAQNIIDQLEGEMMAERPGPFPPFDLPVPVDARLQGIVNRWRNTMSTSAQVGENRSWLEGLHSELGDVQTGFIQERDEVDNKMRELERQRDMENMPQAEYDASLTALTAQRAEIDVRINEANAYLDRILSRNAEIAQRNPDRSFAEQTDRIKNEIEAIRVVNPYEAMKRLGEMAGALNVEEHIDPGLLQYIAQYEEVSERFFDAIISKPFAQPDVHYSQSLGFNAGINKLAFLNAVRTVNKDRHEYYSHLAETSEHSHEMNRTILSASGNPDAFVSYARVITHQHLQTATQLDGVEKARHLYELAYGRIYSKTERVTGDNYEPEIVEWVQREFRALVEKGQVKSRFLDETGQRRPLEAWEAERALAIGRNITTSFYRQSELMSWSKIPLAWERWIESIPTEFVVRAMGGFKWLSYRFRIGQGSGGTELVALMMDKIKRSYIKKAPKGRPIRLKDYDNEGLLTKVGKLDIAEELYPVGFFKGAGFDKGWRIFQAYLRNDTMRIVMPESTLTPAQIAALPEDEQKLLKDYGYRPTLGDFLFEKEYLAQLVEAENKKLEGVEIPPELLLYDDRKQTKLVARDVIPLLGFHKATKDEIASVQRGPTTVGKLYTIGGEQYAYDSLQDQIHLNFGTLLSFGPFKETVKTMLWLKTADVLPLTTAYLLSEEGVVLNNKGKVANRNGGVREILQEERFRNLRGDGDNLFSQEFELKLIMLQEDRINRQIQEQKDAIAGRRQAQTLGLDLDNTDIRLTDNEKAFVGELQRLGRENAPVLAKINFPHVPFHTDTTFQDADYTKIRGETFARRQGSDFSAFVQINNAYNAIQGKVSAKYEDIMGHLGEIVQHMSTPENNITGQDVAAPILKSYLELCKQFAWTKVPGIRTFMNAIFKGTSRMQQIFGPNGPSDDESEIALKVQAARERQIVRGEQLPNEDKSQVDALLDELGGQWWNVFWRELRNALAIYFTLLFLEAGKKVVTEKG